MTALARAGRIAWEQGDYEAAETLGEECVALSRELGDAAGRAEALYVLGATAMSRVELERASAVFEEAAALRRELGDKAGLAYALQGLGCVEVGRRDFERAVELHEESLALAREAGDNFGIMLALGLGALVAAYRGEHERARTLCAEGLEAVRPTGSIHGVSFMLQILAVSASSEGRPARAARLWGAAAALGETIGTILQPIERRDYGPYIDAARARLGEAAWEAALEEGRRMTQEEAVEYALSEEEPAPSPLLATPVHEVPAGRPDALTPRQKEISVLVARGFTSRRIASELTISERTVETHIGRILKKLGLSSRTQLATWVIQRWPPPQSPS
jgi:non-specific serine/threonine protein kinase